MPTYINREKAREQRRVMQGWTRRQRRDRYRRKKARGGAAQPNAQRRYNKKYKDRLKARDEPNLLVSFDISGEELREKLAEFAAQPDESTDGSTGSRPSCDTSSPGSASRPGSLRYFPDDSSISSCDGILGPVSDDDDSSTSSQEDPDDSDFYACGYNDEDNQLPSPSMREANFFADAGKSPAKAALLFYLNSGLFRFEQYKDYDSNYDGKPINLQQVLEDVQAEKLTDSEYDQLIKHFYRCHSYTDFEMQSCACCGLRQIERPESPEVVYRSMPLSHPNMAPLKYTAKQKKNFDDFSLSPQSTVQIPVDNDWTLRTINLADARSVYKQASQQDTLYWHLHPELVETHADGSNHVQLCPSCHNCLQSKQIPPNSIASGVDFGYYERLGLTLPNLHEQLMLSRGRLYFVMVKVSSNAKGQINFNRDNSMRCHAILFPHNSVEIATYMFGSDLFEENGMLEMNSLKKLMQMYMVDPKGRPDAIARDLFRTVNLLARPFVIAQWLTVLKWLHPHYTDIDVSNIRDRLQSVISEVNEHVINTSIAVDDPDIISFENSKGSDVAQVRNRELLDPSQANLEEARFRQDSQPTVEAGPTRQAENADNTACFNDVSYSYITNTQNAYHSATTGDYRLKALQKFADLKNVDAAQDSFLSDVLFDKQDVHDFLNQFPPSMNFATAREEIPVSDFSRDDKGLSTSFPHVFMLGQAYSVQPGSLSVEKRKHLLNQFHLTPSKDRRLLGFLFDVQQRLQVINGVKAHVEGNRKAIKLFRDLMDSDTERQLLRKAVEFPHSQSSKKILRKYLSHLQYSSRRVSYGTLEGMQLKHNLLAKSYRYSPPTGFFTISPVTSSNPRGVRLALKVLTNDSFPSVFEEGCPYGANGNEFAESMLAEIPTLAEGYINLSPSKRAEMAIEDPVAFVQEYKNLLNDILTILLGVNLEGRAYYSKLDSQSVRRSVYYKCKKGSAGHSFAAGGVTEGHAKGTLHWHFTLYSGISPYVLQRFAHLPEVCKCVSEVLDSMYVSEVSPGLHAGAIINRFLREQHTFSSMSDDVLQSIRPKEFILDRKDPLRTMGSPDMTGQHDGSLVANSTNPGDGPIETDDATSTSRSSVPPPSPTAELNHEDASLSSIEGAFSLAGQATGSATQPSPRARRLPEDASLSSIASTEGALSSERQGSNSVAQQLDQCGNPSSIFGSSCSDSYSDLYCEEEPADFTRYYSVSKVNRLVAYQASHQNFHVHQMTCHKGSQGKIGCRLSCPGATVDQTHPVELQVREARRLQPDANGNTPLDKPEPEDRPRMWQAGQPRDYWNEGQVPQHRLQDILSSKRDDSVIVWETKRPFIHIPALEVEPMQQGDPRAYIVGVMRELLQDVPSFGRDNCVFWNWIQDMASIDELLDIFLHLREKLPAANGFVASFNPVIALCTGSHVNASLLGSTSQAKSALFYLIPYQGKTKFPLMDSLSLLDHTINHISKYPSKAADSGTTMRTVKHLLTRTINRIHLQVEVSDYQVAASLLELPSMMMTDQFAYGDPLALCAFRAKMELTSFSTEHLSQLGRDITAIREPPTGNHQVDESLRQSLIAPLPGTTHQERNGWMEDDLEGDNEPSEHPPFLDQGLPGAIDGHGNPPQPVNFADTTGRVDGPSLIPGYIEPGFPEDRESPRTGEDDGHPDSRPAVDPRDILHGLGYTMKIRTFIDKRKLKDKRQKRQHKYTFLPAVATYLYRGDELADLNYYEYLACCRFENEKPRAAPTTSRHFQEHFRLDDSFLAPETSYHVLCMKQRTPLLVKKLPKHPGKQPRSLRSKAGAQWKARADFFAKFYLTLFRPDCIRSNHGYTWGDLLDFIKELQEDRSIISKFRLMTMHTHIGGLKAPESVKKMTSQYRSRARDLWTERQKQYFNAFNIHRENRANTTQPLDEIFSPDMLSQGTLNNMFKRLSRDALQVKALSVHTPQVYPRQTLNHSPVCKLSVQMLTEKVEEINHWKRSSKRKRSHSSSGATQSSYQPPTRAKKRKLLLEIRNGIASRGKERAEQQLQLFDVFRNTLLGETDPRKRAPAITLVHGPPGVGKSHVRKAISEGVKSCAQTNDNTAFNAINAIDMENGVTTCTDTGFNCKLHFSHVGDFSPHHIQQAQSKIGSCPSVDVFNHIDEVGTQAPAHLARKNALCQIISNNELDFGGRTTILYGDMTQLGPVKAGKSLTQACLELYASDSIRSKLKMPGRSKISKTKHAEATILPDAKGPKQTSPYYIGTRLITSVRWFELLQQQRSDDESHNRIVDKLYNGTPITQMDLKAQYKLFSPEEAVLDEWLTAPALVAINRERFTITHERSQVFASVKGTHVVRWVRDWKDWQQQPADAYLNQAMEDPIFWEYFVPDAPGFLNAPVQRSMSLVNALSMKCHSIKFDHDHQPLFEHMIATEDTGAVIDMPVPPLFVLVVVFPPDDLDNDILSALKKVSLPYHDESGGLLIPIGPKAGQWDKYPQDVRGNANFLPSKCRFRNTFPFELAFSITVHKAQGRTLRRVIVALSECGVSKCSFTFEQLLVALSRVKDGDHIRLLLSGNTEEEKWSSILYVNRLRRDPSIAYFFAGFREKDPTDPNKDWIVDTWCQVRANLNFERMIDEGYFK